MIYAAASGWLIAGRSYPIHTDTERINRQTSCNCNAHPARRGALRSHTTLHRRVPRAPCPRARLEQTSSCLVPGCLRELAFSDLCSTPRAFQAKQNWNQKTTLQEENSGAVSDLALVALSKLRAVIHGGTRRPNRFPLPSLFCGINS